VGMDQRARTSFPVRRAMHLHVIRCSRDLVIKPSPITASSESSFKVAPAVVTHIVVPSNEDKLPSVPLTRPRENSVRPADRNCSTRSIR
jgi:hypothetical protein